MAETQSRKYNGKEFVEAHGYDTYDYGARGYYLAIMRFTTVDPLAEKYYSVSPYAYCAGNPVNAIDPDGTSTYVLANRDGTYRVFAGNSEDNDYNIYVYEIKNGKLIKGRSIGVTTSLTSFYDDTKHKDKNGNERDYGWIGTIDPNDKSGENFLGNIMSNTPDLAEYMPNATKDKTYDFKRTNGSDSRFTSEYKFYRGMPIGSMKGKTVYTSARDIGNIAAGYVAAANGMSYQASRMAFDALQSFESGRPALEGRSLEKRRIVVGIGVITLPHRFKNVCFSKEV